MALLLTVLLSAGLRDLEGTEGLALGLMIFFIALLHVPLGIVAIGAAAAGGLFRDANARVCSDTTRVRDRIQIGFNERRGRALPGGSECFENDCSVLEHRYRQSHSPRERSEH